MLKKNVGYFFLRGTSRKIPCSDRFSSTGTTETDGEFRVLELYPGFDDKKTKQARKQFFQVKELPPREKRMAIRNDWPSVWPTAQSFRPSVVPLPLHQGYTKKKAPPEKYANAELMKIPNFLHLTPPAVKRHCEALKKFCTEFPKELTDDSKCDEHFPLEVITSTYCHSAPTIRDERSRIVTIKVKLSQLNLDYHAKDKLLKLAGPQQYYIKKDTLVLVADRCPVSKQNYDYLIYVLAALYHESQICEPWESEITEEDQLDFFFEGSRHQKRITETVRSVQSARKVEEGSKSDQSPENEIKEYGRNVEKIINDGESEDYLEQYKKNVLKILL